MSAIGGGLHPDMISGPDPGWNLPFECGYDFDCAYSAVDYGYFGGGYDFWYYDFSYAMPGGGQDWTYWNRWRQDHCDAAKSDMQEALVATAGMVASGFGGPFGLIGVAIGAVAVVVAMNHQADNERVCLSSYPGVGGW